MAIQTQLYSQQDLLMESGYGLDNHLGFVPLHQQHQIMQQQFDQFQNSSHQKNLSFLVENNIHHQQQQQSMPFSQGVAAHIEKQRLEFDHFINLQNERLRLTVHHQRKQQISSLLKKFESKAQFLLAQKEEEIAKAATKTMELQNFLKKLEVENLTWQKMAKENESTVASLNGTIQRLRESASLSANAADDAESCCQDGFENKEEAGFGNAICRCCNSRKSRVVLLPCRHLCSCRECAGFLDTCPVCKMVKKGSIEALI